jgi:phosphatidylserine/phosphatidylglycerophosphate/cardiolipin synthase-like enzyme
VPTPFAAIQAGLELLAAFAIFPPVGSLGKEAKAMTWLLLATGFTGGLTLVFLARWAWRQLALMPSAAVYFSPKGGCTEAVVRELKAARREVLVQAYSFTSKDIAKALVDAKLRGLRVEVILDRSNEQENYSDLKFFIDQGLAPHIDAHHAIAHNKVMIIDGRTVITGSFNFTHQAEAENAENLLVIKGNTELAAGYRKNFEAHKAHAQPPAVKAAEGHAARKAA